MQKVVGWILVAVGCVFVVWGLKDLFKDSPLGNPADDPMFGLIFGAKVAFGVTLIYTGLTLAGVLPSPKRDWLTP
jgi:hypothetical protein